MVPIRSYLMVPIRSYLFCRFIRTCKVGFCREAPKPLISWGNVTGERGEPPCTSPVSRKYERVGTKVRTNRDLRGGMPTCFFRRGAPGPGIFDRRAAEQGRAAGVRMNWGRSTNESVHSRPPGPDLPGKAADSPLSANESVRREYFPPRSSRSFRGVGFWL
jgi:hypothetical protein